MKKIDIVVKVRKGTVVQEEISIALMMNEDRLEDPAKLMEKARLSKELNTVLDQIGEREAKILRLRFGLNGCVPETLESVAKKMKLSRERVRQLEERALLRLRRLAYRTGLVEMCRRPV